MPRSIGQLWSKKKQVWSKSTILRREHTNLWESTHLKVHLKRIIISSTPKMSLNQENNIHVPNFHLAQLIHEYDIVNRHGKINNEMMSSILYLIKSESMATFYESICKKFSWNFDKNLFDEMKVKNEKSALSFDDKLKDLENHGGEIEILDALFDKAKFWSLVGEFTLSSSAYDKIITRDKTSTARKIDSWMGKARICLFEMNFSFLKDCITNLKALVEIGGDWDRRNRLKVYEALYHITQREFHNAAKLLLDSVSTFACDEICTYNQFMIYMVIANIMTLPRIDLFNKVVVNPQVISVIRLYHFTSFIILIFFNAFFLEKFQ